MGTGDSGREPVLLVEIDQPICENVYGVAPCTAILSNANPNKCFNTRKTCQDATNFSLTVIPLTLRFCQAQEVIPRAWQAIPCLESVDTTPCRINPGNASRNSGPLGARATVTITMRDLPSADFKVDPYQDERYSGAAQFSGVGYNPIDRGTFWTKWLRRNPYYTNWPIRIREGYIEDNPADMTTRNYIIEDISGPDSNGKITIKAQDVFGMADEKSATCPVASHGELDRDITATGYTLNCRSGVNEWTRHGATNEWYWNNSSFTLHFEPDEVYIDGVSETQAAPGALANHEWGWGDIDGLGFDTLYVRVDGVDPDTKPADYIIAHYTTYLHLVEWEVGEYPAGGGTVRIGDECFTYTTATEDSPTVGTLTFEGVIRGTDGTTADTHSDGDRAQLCYRVANADNVYCWEVAEELLTAYANIPAAYIPSADWALEGTTWIPTFTVTTLITEPTPVNKLLGELCEQCLFDIWWDERDQEIKLRALRTPSEEAVELNERQHIIKDSLSLKSDLSQRVSQIWLFWSQKDPTKDLDDTKNYSNVRIIIEPYLEDESHYGAPAIKQIFSRWLEDENQAYNVNQRYLSRFEDGVKYLKIKVDAKDRDSLWTGGVASVSHHAMVDDVGNLEERLWQVISAEEVDHGHAIEYLLQNYLVEAEHYAAWMSVINCRSVVGQWTLRGGGAEYSFDNSGGTLIGKPAAVYLNEPNFMNGATEGTIGALNPGEWAWGNAHALGYNTIYVRLSDGTDPDGKASGYVSADWPMYDDLPDPDNAPTGAWWSDANGQMSDGDLGWSYT